MLAGPTPARARSAVPLRGTVLRRLARAAGAASLVAHRTRKKAGGVGPTRLSQSRIETFQLDLELEANHRLEVPHVLRAGGGAEPCVPRGQAGGDDRTVRIELLVLRVLGGRVVVGQRGVPRVDDRNV